MSASARHKATKRPTGSQKTIKELANLTRKHAGATKEKEVSDSAPPSQVMEDETDIEAWTPGTYTVFKIIMSARLCAAAWHVVGDCDETYNYWEPTHYLMFGKGFQTWEYSPVYAIRSYAYLLLHTLPMRLYGLVFTPNPVMLFFFTRCVLAFACTLSEVYFYKGVWQQFGSNVARVTLCFLIFSAGLFISSTAYLPSSFCMYMTFLSLGAWFQGQFQVAIMATASSTILGWPFAGAIGIPIAMDMILRRQKVTLFILWSLIALFIFLVPVILIDKHFYGKLVITPLNIVLYNVFTPHGPDLYGTEPFSYYIINCFLNFNVVFPLAVLSLPFTLFTFWYTKEKEKGIPIYLSVAAMYIWMAVFFTRPHKEERFLFPIYPLIVLGGGVSVDCVQRLWDYIFPQIGKRFTVYAENTSWISIFFGIFFSLMSVSRIVAIYQGYHAPLDLFVELNKVANDPKIHTLPEDRQVNICISKEWYRFPSSFFLPGHNWHLQFVQSEFKGQLPKPYSSGQHATHIIPTEMNDENREEPSRYINITKCHYLVDLDLPRETILEPKYADHTDEWKILTSIPFLDASRSHRVFRAFYIPFVSSKYCNYENYILMKTTRTKRHSSKQRGNS